LGIRADVIEGVQATDVAMAMDAKLNELRAKLPNGYQIDAGGELGENSGAQESINVGMPLMMAVILGFLMIQMKSLSRTFMVLLTAPLGIIGVAMALLVFHKPFGFVAILIVSIRHFDWRHDHAQHGYSDRPDPSGSRSGTL